MIIVCIGELLINYLFAVLQDVMASMAPNFTVLLEKYKVAF